MTNLYPYENRKKHESTMNERLNKSSRTYKDYKLEKAREREKVQHDENQRNTYFRY